MADITKEDLENSLDKSREMILEEVRMGFAGVHRRQDITNGRVGVLEVTAGRQDERIKNIGREVFGRRVSDRDEQQKSASWRESLITKRDVAVVTGTVAIVVAVVKFLAWVQPAVGVLKP